jgi:hypothetical protein
MTRTTETAFHTRPDGSIDTARYMQRGRRMRSEQAHRMMGAATPGRGALRRGGLVAAALALVFTSRQSGG